MFAKLIATTAILASAAIALPAQAAMTTDAQGRRVIEVPYTDIDMADPAQVAKLHQRITRAARQVCADSDRTRAAACVASIRRTTETAIADAGQRQSARLAQSEPEPRAVVVGGN
jgi:UrcA family protein